MFIKAHTAYSRLDTAVKFVKQAIDLIGQTPNPPTPLRRVRESTYPKNIYDYLANLVFEICFAASSVSAPPEICWTIHHNCVWSELMDGIGNEGAAWKIIRLKVRRLLYDEIMKLSEFPNYKGSRILGLCLNVFGMKRSQKKNSIWRNSYPLVDAVHAWTRKNYLWLRQENPDVADSVLIGSVSFDEHGNRLVKSDLKGLNREVPKSFLDLEQPPEKTGIPSNAVSAKIEFRRVKRHRTEKAKVL